MGRIHSDRGHEFSGEFVRWSRSRGIYLTKTAGDDPRGNGRAEVTVKQIKEQVRRILRQAEVGARWWPWAVRYVGELNRCQRLDKTPNFPSFMQEVSVKKRTWRQEAFETTGGEGKISMSVTRRSWTLDSQRRGEAESHEDDFATQPRNPWMIDFGVPWK